MSLIQTIHGRLRVVDPDTDMISRFLARFGEWALLEARFLGAIIPAGAAVLDAGAFLGTFTLGLTRQRAYAKFCLVEANAAVTPLLRDNVQRRCDVPCEVVAALLAGPSHAEGARGWYTADNVGAACFGEPCPDPDAVRWTEPCGSVVSLGELSAKHGPFDLMKLDLEGMELPLLRAERAFLEGARGALWVECNEVASALDLASLLLELDREVWYFAFPAFNPDNYNGSTDPLLPFAYESGLLAVQRGSVSVRMSSVPGGCVLRRIEAPEHLKAAMWLTPRFAPPGWDARTREEIVALAGHIMVDDRYEDFLKETPVRTWQSPLARERAEIDRLRSELAALRTARSSGHRSHG